MGHESPDKGGRKHGRNKRSGNASRAGDGDDGTCRHQGRDGADLPMACITE